MARSDRQARVNRRSSGVLHALGAVGAGLVVAAGCVEAPPEWPDAPQPLCSMGLEVPQRRDPALDLLLVVESTPGMAEIQARLGLALGAHLEELVRGPESPVDVHIAVTSADLGAGPYTSIPGCERPGGDGGRLLVPEGCPGPVGAPYVVDLTPRGCEVVGDLGTTCLAHTCTQAHCDQAHAEQTWLVEDGDGCPRCRNYDATSLAEAVACLARLGEGGCAFAQPLEAALRALEGQTGPTGFLRENTALGLVLATRQDDCSAAVPEVLFDSSQDSLEGPLGPLTPFRCFEHGVSCDMNDRLAVGWRQGCVPQEGAGGLLTTVDALRDRLAVIKGPQWLAVSALTGLTSNGAVRVDRDAQGRPVLAPACESAEASPLPSVRLGAFLSAVLPPEELPFGLVSACEPEGAERVIDWLGYLPRPQPVSAPICFPAPLLGCTDPGAAAGVARDDQPCNDACLPSCQATELARRGTPEELRTAVAPCLEVCPEGPCPGNRDPARAYLGGQPLGPRDPWLPAPACFAVRYVAGECPGANHAEIVIVRRANPPSRTFVRVNCRCALPTELLCDDGEDNDGDCRVDGADPDCR